MRYNKTVQDDYIDSIGTGDGGEEITREEYEEILAVIKNAPPSTDGVAYRLRVDLTWEEAELPPLEEEPETPDDDPTTEEMLAAIKEGVNAI